MVHECCEVLQGNSHEMGTISELLVTRDNLELPERIRHQLRLATKEELRHFEAARLAFVHALGIDVDYGWAQQPSHVRSFLVEALDALFVDPFSPIEYGEVVARLHLSDALKEALAGVYPPWRVAQAELQCWTFVLMKQAAAAERRCRKDVTNAVTAGPKQEPSPLPPMSVAPYVDLRLHVENDKALKLSRAKKVAAQIDCWCRLAFLALTADTSFEAEFHYARVRTDGSGLVLPLQLTTWLLIPIFHLCRLASTNVLWFVICAARPEVNEVRNMLKRRHCRSFFGKKRKPEAKPAAVRFTLLYFFNIVTLVSLRAVDVSRIIGY